ncbi:MAG: hypothetical protein ACI3V3_09000 [Faecousia sp.]
MNNQVKAFVVWFASTFLLMVLIFSLFISGMVTFGYSGFGVDSKGNLYVGKGDNWRDRIEVFNGDQKIRAIDIEYHAYVFTVASDDTILLYSYPNAYKMSLDGEILEQTEIGSRNAFYDLYKDQFPKNGTIVTNGKTYVMKSKLLRPTIWCDEEVIYQMPMLSFLVRLLVIYLFISAFYMIPKTIIMVKRHTGWFGSKSAS